MADKAYYAANKNGSLFRRFFKTNDPDDAVASEGGSCTPDSTHAYVHDKQEMYICPYFFEHDLTERASTLIHELTHHEDTLPRSKTSCTPTLTPFSPYMQRPLTAAIPSREAHMPTPAAVTEVTPNMVMVIFTPSTFLKFQPASAAALDTPMTPNVQYSEGLAAVNAVEWLVLVIRFLCFTGSSSMNSLAQNGNILFAAN
ncbi:hypothetical protein MCOR10_000492 [Pyricularia oryzae]|nr:hypothetical protein MCOR10_000492 [Pyricularia oryzae]